jgi:hypothetical protein
MPLSNNKLHRLHPTFEERMEVPSKGRKGNLELFVGLITIIDVNPMAESASGREEAPDNFIPV